MRHYTIEALKAIAKIMEIPTNVPFYACEVGLNSGEINSLSQNHFIVPTGNVKEVFVHLYGDRYKKVEIKQWVINDADIEILCQRVIEDVTELSELVKKF